MEFKRKADVTAGIPTASLPDIVFMLLIFFMVSTVFKESSGLPVVLPDARKIEKLQGKRNIAVIWADRSGNISIDDRLVEVNSIRNLVYNKVADPLHPMKLVSLRIDKEVKMGNVTDIQEELREVGGTALNINYSTRTAAD
ncbi:biopolymer transporter ExbD [candidate division KSB1 bacterium]|nr:biopolymer transporter ExbD [candidate division KSB1 bacterium]